MNVNTGHLVDFQNVDLSLREAFLKKGYQPITDPKNRKEAEELLDGNSETYVNLKGKSSLADWARKQRKIKSKRSTAKKSKRANRRK